jgi:hypothetical protein
MIHQRSAKGNFVPFALLSLKLFATLRKIFDSNLHQVDDEQPILHSWRVAVLAFNLRVV